MGVYRFWRMLPLFLGFLPLLPAQSQVLWDIGGNDQFDNTLSYRILRDQGDSHGRVIVDLEAGEPKCPLGLGRWFADRQRFAALTLKFSSPTAGSFWLHVTWRPQGSIETRFLVDTNGTTIAPDRKTLPDPQGWRGTRFRITLRPGKNEVTLKLHRGRGLRFKYLALCTHKDVTPCPTPYALPWTSRAWRTTAGSSGNRGWCWTADTFLFPKKISGNPADRIHAWILWQCEERYGSSFWPDFWREVRRCERSPPSHLMWTARIFSDILLTLVHLKNHDLYATIGHQ